MNTTSMLDNSRYTKFSTNITWHGIHFLRETTEADRRFDSAASAVVDSYAAVMDNPTPSNMDRFNDACDAYRASRERGSNKPVIDSYALSHFQIDQDAPVTTLDIERARAAIGQGGNS